MNRYIIAVIRKTYDQLWNPKLENIKIRKTYDQLWNPKFLNLKYHERIYFDLTRCQRLEFLKETTTHILPSEPFFLVPKLQVGAGIEGDGRSTYFF